MDTDNRGFFEGSGTTEGGLAGAGIRRGGLELLHETSAGRGRTNPLRRVRAAGGAKGNPTGVAGFGDVCEFCRFKDAILQHPENKR